MIRSKEKLIGLLGAIIIHLIAGIILMIVKINSFDINKYMQDYKIVIEFNEIPYITDSDAETGTAVGSENIYSDDQEILNIARNLAEKPDVKIDPNDYLEKVKEEMIKSGLLGPDNFIDEQKRLMAEKQNEGIEVQQNAKAKSDEIIKESNEIAAKYSGPTRIYYYLPERVQIYLPIPVYKCETGGKVTISIEVDPKGFVSKAFVVEGESTTLDPCLIEAAISSAQISRFSPDASATKNIFGTITYHFVPQWEKN
ncbi:MAG: hypothetical protein KBG40_00195 [Bacteroidales bacterium]|nr:hypothetical protein [Bacteroidales bacterium]